jgi:P4 family phage/plasmid primase-like protien
MPSGKYGYISSKKLGASCGTPAHIPLAVTGPCRVVRVTEGELKAEVATELSGILTISCGSVNSWRVLIEPLHALQASQVLLAFDADSLTNDKVAKQLVAAHKGLTAEGFTVDLEWWEGEHKGIDDLLFAGRQADVLTGQAVLDKLQQLSGIVLAAERNREKRTKVKTIAAADDEDGPPFDESEAPQDVWRKPAKDIDPAEEADLVVDSLQVDDVCTLRFHMDDWHKWQTGRYVTVLPSEIRAEVVNYLNTRCHHLSSGVVNNVLDQLRAKTLLPFGYTPPCWVKTPEGLSWDPAAVLSCKNGLLYLPDFADGEPALIPATPRLFTPAALDFAFDEHAPPPLRWLDFLAELWGDDQQSIDALQEWFGYFLVPDTRQQKMFWIIGPKRSGKGTIARVAVSLIGNHNVCSPTLSSLAGNFGLQNLLGKTLAIISDARLSGRTDQAVVTERLLSITGEDYQDVDRKHKSQVNLKLLTRMMVLSNELPRLHDASGALSSRMIILRTSKSFYGEENINLTEQLLAERPGILLWAIEGWKRLQARGKFLQPTSGAELREQMDDLASPVGAFLKDRCEFGPDLEEPTKSLYAGYQAWMLANGSKASGDSIFARDLFAAAPHVRSVRRRDGEKRLHVYLGLRMLPSDGGDSLPGF